MNIAHADALPVRSFADALRDYFETRAAYAGNGTAGQLEFRFYRSLLRLMR